MGNSTVLSYRFEGVENALSATLRELAVQQLRHHILSGKEVLDELESLDLVAEHQHGSWLAGLLLFLSLADGGDVLEQQAGLLVSGTYMNELLHCSTD